MHSQLDEAKAFASSRLVLPFIGLLGLCRCVLHLLGLYASCTWLSSLLRRLGASRRTYGSLGRVA